MTPNNAAASSPLRGSQPSDREAGSMASLLELAERCEAATGPSHTLDDDIAEANNKDWRSYTHSLDAAMTLVPEGFVTRRVVFDGQRCRLSMFNKHSLGQAAEAATEPLALCAAALRARAAQ